MLALFEGYDGAHGTHGRGVANMEKGGKLEIKTTARTIREPVTVELWAAHIDGKTPIGIIPIRRDNMCVWGCIDVDQYDLDLGEIVMRLKRDNLPLTVCRTKSGGAHIYLFLQEAVPAADLQAKLKHIAAALGFGTSEIFPKQASVLSDQGDLGNWLNMPYFGGDKSDRYCIAENGRGLTLEQFLKKAEANRLTAEAFTELAKEKKGAKEGGEFGDGPPCLQHLAATGFPEGQRNNGLMALATFLKKKHPDKWVNMLSEFNARYMNPPLPASEVVAITNGLKKRDYNYRCGDQPIVQFCNAGLCRTRKFGVGAGGSMPVLANLSVLNTDEPIWFLDVANKRIELSTSDLINPLNFQRRCMETVHIVPPVLKRDTWQGVLQGLIDNIVVIDAPQEVGVRGQFFELLESFCTDRQRAQARDEILLGKAWWEDSGERVFFRMKDLQEHLDRARFKGMTRTQMTSQIRSMGGNHEFFKIKGRGTNCWWIPTANLQQQTEAHELPSIKEEVI